MPVKDNMMEILVEAKQAAADRDWTRVSHALAEMSIRQANRAEQSQILDLALQVLTAGDFQDRWQIAKVLPPLGEIAIKPLLALLQDVDVNSEVHWFIGRILSEFPEPQVVDELAQLLLQHPETEVARIVLQSLIQMGTLAVEQLTHLLVTHPQAAVTALAHIRHSQTISPLLTVVHHVDPQIRALAIEALSSFHDPRVPPQLIDRLTDKVAEVRRVAVTGLGLRADLAAELSLAQRLSPLLGDINLEVAKATAIALGRIADAPAATELFARYQQENCPEPLRQQIVRCLGWVDIPESLQYLQEILTSHQETLIPETIRAIGHSRQPTAVQVLAKYLQTMPAHCPVQIKQEIALHLGNFSKTNGVKEIIGLLADPSDQVRWHAIYCLQRLDPAVVDSQLQAWQESGSMPPELLAGIEQYRVSSSST